MSDMKLEVKQLGDFETMGIYTYEFYIRTNESVHLTIGQQCKVLFVFYDKDIEVLDYPNPVIRYMVYTAPDAIDLSETPIVIGPYTTANADLATNLASAATIYFNMQ